MKQEVRQKTTNNRGGIFKKKTHFGKKFIKRTQFFLVGVSVYKNIVCFPAKYALH